MEKELKAEFLKQESMNYDIESSLSVSSSHISLNDLLSKNMSSNNLLSDSLSDNLSETLSETLSENTMSNHLDAQIFDIKMPEPTPINDINERLQLKQEIERLNGLVKQQQVERVKFEDNFRNELMRHENDTYEMKQKFMNEIHNNNKIIAKQGRKLNRNNSQQSLLSIDNKLVEQAIADRIKEMAMSEQAYNYSVLNKDKPSNIPGVLPPAEDDSSLNDPSNNIVDPSTTKKTYKKFTYKQIQDEITDNYFDNRTSYSSALDIIGTYLRGQKLIYMESKSYCENKLNRLMMPSIFLSTAATVLSAIVKEFYWGAYLIASVNGIIAFLLAIVNYLKLDAASEAHKITAHQYDKLQTKIEFLSGQTLLFDSKKETIEKELEDVKKKIEEIKETNQFIVPKKIRTLYPIMFNTNVFLIIKKIDDITKKKINAIKDLKNEKNYLIEVLKAKRSAGKDNKTIAKIEARMSECQEEKKRHENNIVVLKSAFSVIDEMFMKEMENAEKYKNMTIRRWFLCGFGVKEQIKDPRQINRFIEDIMNPYKEKVDETVVKTPTNDIDQLVNDLTQTKKVLKSKRLDELKRRQKTIKDLKKANILLKENIGITEQIYNKMEVYDKLERGEYDKINYEANDKEKAIKLNRPKKIVRLLGIGNDEQEHINLRIHSDDERGSISGSDRSDPYTDFEVCKRDYEK